MAITKRQREIYDFIARFVAEHGYSPSFEEIGDGTDLSSLATVHKHITNLEKKGLLKRDYNRSRSIDVLPPRGALKKSMEVAASTSHRVAADGTHRRRASGGSAAESGDHLLRRLHPLVKGSLRAPGEGRLHAG